MQRKHVVRCSRRQWLALVLGTSFSPRVVAHDDAHAHEPDAEEIALGSLADAELAFARAARERGRRAALVRYMANDGIVLDRAALRLAQLEADLTDSGETCEIEPAQVSVSAAHDIGCGTGAYAFTGGREVRRGVYLTVWRRQQETWRIELTASAGTPAPVDFVDLGAAPRPGFKGKPEPRIERAKLLRLDARARDARRGDNLAAAQMRSYREGIMPRIGESTRDTHGLPPSFVRISRSADLAVLSGAADERHASWYVHVWLRDPAGVWRMAYDLQTPGAASE